MVDEGGRRLAFPPSGLPGQAQAKACGYGKKRSPSGAWAKIGVPKCNLGTRKNFSPLPLSENLVTQPGDFSGSPSWLVIFINNIQVLIHLKDDAGVGLGYLRLTCTLVTFRFEEKKRDRYR
jgi:hypothetical protein